MIDPKLGYDPEKRFIEMPGFPLYQMSGMGEIRHAETKTEVKQFNRGGTKARHKFVRIMNSEGVLEDVQVQEKQYQIWAIEDAAREANK